MSLWHQGIKKRDPAYWKLLRTAAELDIQRRVEMEQETAELEQRASSYNDSFDGEGEAHFRGMMHYARDYMVRHMPEIPMTYINNHFDALQESVSRGTVDITDVSGVYRDAGNYLSVRKKMFSFPGVHLAAAITHAVKALHYENVMKAVTGKVQHAAHDGQTGCVKTDANMPGDSIAQ